MKTLRLALATLLALLIVGAAPLAHAERRVALVIGNAAYADAPLRNPVNDARDFVAKLQQLGFDKNDIVLRTDLKLRDIGPTLREFRAKLTADSVAVIFYAGHGLQVKGENYLPAVDAAIQGEEDVPQQSLKLATLMGVLDENRTRMSLVFLDACRNNPYARSFRNAARGLAREAAPSGTLISYATRPGAVAADGTGRNGLFTAQLLNHMATPGIPIEQVLKRVASGVKAASRGEQEAWWEGSIEGDFYFRAGEPLANLELRREPPVPSVAQLEEEAWKAALAADNLAGYETYLQEYPKGRYASTARIKIAALRQASAPPSAAPAAPAARPREKCADCPEMVAIPAGSFTMGSPADEAGRGGDEGPQHVVQIAAFELGRHEVTVGEFRRFVQATAYRTDAEKNSGSMSGCSTLDTGIRKWREGRHWDNLDFTQSDRHPVVCVSWNDAQAYISWLNDRSGRRYRLPSEAEWEYAARAGTQTARFWGDDRDAACRYANVADETPGPGGHTLNDRHRCSDDQPFSAEVGTYPANPFGLKDMLGNVAEWTQDCSHYSYTGAPTDGSAWTSGGDCDRRVLRGGSWHDLPHNVRSASRDTIWLTNFRIDLNGFRLARTAP